MAQLKDKIENALNESRTLILGTQVLLGFQFRAFIENNFEKYPPELQYAKLVGLTLMLVTLGLLMSPAAYHRIVTRGEDAQHLHSFTSAVVGIALLPFALGLGIDVTVSIERVLGLGAGIVAGVLAIVMSLSFWYGLEVIAAARHKAERKEKRAMQEKNGESKSEGTELKDKIKQVLTETRIVLPGAQALLGFQFIGFLAEGFEKLPELSKYVHIASLALIGLSTILLMAPAAYHRIVEQGEDSERLHHFAGNMIIAAMVTLALGIVGDFYVVFEKVTKSSSFALIAAVLMLAFFYGLWFAFTLFRRQQLEQKYGSVSAARSQSAAE